MSLRLVKDACQLCGNEATPRDGMWFNPDGSLHNTTCAGYGGQLVTLDFTGGLQHRVDLAAAGLRLHSEIIGIAAREAFELRQHKRAARLIYAARQVKDAILTLQESTGGAPTPRTDGGGAPQGGAS